MRFYRILIYIFVVVALITIQTAWAQKPMYVTDRIQVVVRVAPNQDAKPINYITSGEIVNVLENNNEGWIKIRSNDGKEGWALTRYFMEEPSAALRLKDLDPQSKNLAQKLEEARKEILDIKAKLSSAENFGQQTEAAFQKLRIDSADVVRLRNDYQKIKDDYQQQSQKIEELATENESLRFGANLKWFLAGGSLLLVGWLIGVAYGRRKRGWSSSLE